MERLFVKKQYLQQLLHSILVLALLFIFMALFSRGVKANLKVLFKMGGGGASVKRSRYQGGTRLHDCFYDGAADGRALRIGLLCQPNPERKERSETFENEIIQHVNYTDISPMFFL